MALLPGMAIHVHDAYVAGIGTLHPAVVGLISLTHQQGGDDIARGELMRYMMERTGLPSTNTVQVPHNAWPQPYLVPVNCRVSRSAQSSGVSGAHQFDVPCYLQSV